MDISAIYTSAKATLDLLSGIESNSVLMERVALLKDQLEILRYSHEATQKELTKTKAKCAELENEIARYRNSEEFVFKHGAAFKKTAGGYIDTPYCPNCKLAVGSGFDDFPFQCKKCGWISTFTQNELTDILKSLP